MSSMSNTNVDRVLELAKALTTQERAAVAHELLAGLGYPGEVTGELDADAAWRAEVRSRAERVFRGEAHGTDAADVHASIERDLAKR